MSFPVETKGFFPWHIGELSLSPPALNGPTMHVSTRHTPGNDKEDRAMMIKCVRCGLAYSHTRSTSALVLTYCGMLCEVADLGYSLAAFEKAPVAGIRTTITAPSARPEGAGVLAGLGA
jgi:hypothetical protein